ncbi:Uma2 family endonuclease [Tundrisphaera sp. TA3]|uniref:Uma2 family endonuclease n=1 Tax=Tundrisphaera sp. TA3 TaxID=3435775 RepID=UPI003EBCFF0F
MATALKDSSPATPAPAGPAIGERRFLLRNLGWSGYEALRALIGDGSTRVNYANGDVELMSPISHHHERFKSLLGFMVLALTEELRIRRNVLGSTTFKKRLADRGLEPDESFYLANAGRIRDQDRIDLDVDPPPDLCIEVEITNSLLDKLDIYAAIGVPEIWRHDGDQLSVLTLNRDGRYVATGESASFPFLPLDGLTRFLRDYNPAEETQWGLDFRTWVREVVAPLRQQAGPGPG